MAKLESLKNHPILTGLLCSLLVIPTIFIGQETALLFRRGVDRVISQSDFLFNWVANSVAATNIVHLVQNWGAIVVYGLVTAALAMLITRYLVRGAVSWKTITVVTVVWAAIYFADQNMSGLLSLIPIVPEGNGLSTDLLGVLGSAMFFCSFTIGLVTVGTPWRAT